MDKRNKAVTVVVPVFNREGLIVRCLDSIKAQTYRPINLIVVDNNSTDGSAAVVGDWISTNASDDFRAKLLHQPVQGAMAARQMGLDAVDTEHVVFFDSDDAMRPELLSTAMENIGDNDIFVWRRVVHEADGREFISRMSRGNLLRHHLFNALLATQVYMVRTEFLRECGGWNGALRGWNDWEVGTRLLLRNPRIKITDQPLCDVYCQEESITGVDFQSKAGVWEEALDTIEKDIRDASPLIEKWRREKSSLYEGHDTDRLLGYVNYRRAILAAHYRKEGRMDLAVPLMIKAIDAYRGNPLRQILLKLVYRYTAAGGRGAYYLWR